MHQIRIRTSRRQRGSHFTFICGIVLAISCWNVPLHARPAAPAQSELFSELDLSSPELKTVRDAVDKKDWSEAVHAWASYLRKRDSVPWPMTSPITSPTTHASTNAAPAADRIAKLAVDGTVYGGLVQVPHTFADNNIDWLFNATINRPGIPPNEEWQWQLCRMDFWKDLAAAYRATGDERYAQAWVEQLRSFARQCPPPDHVENIVDSAWRTIDSGIRAGGSWPDALMTFRSSSAVTDDDLAEFTYLFEAQANYLRKFSTRGNHLTMEMSGLYTTGSLFPELRQAAEWRNFAAEKMFEQEKEQFLPDGAQFELSPGYHNVALDNLCAIPRVAAQMNRISELPQGYVQGLEHAFDFDLNLMTPDRRLPKFNDCWPVDIADVMRHALAFFPSRQDFRWVATDGAQGTMPAGDSKEFSWAGFYVMRSGWLRDSNCLIFRAGPIGFAHCHQDKLSVVCWPYGRELLFDDGGGSYEKSDRRAYDTSTFAHNTVIVDGQPQMRQTVDPSANVSKAPIDAHWQSTPAYDFAEGVYDDGYGAVGHRIATHTRRVLFVKPDVYVIADTLAPIDAADHTYQARWNLFTTHTVSDSVLSAVTTDDENLPNLTVIPLNADHLDVRAVSAQTKPELLGWYIIKDRVPPILPATTVLHTIHGTGVQTFLTLLLPLKADAKSPMTAVTHLSGGVTLVSFDDGRKMSINADANPSGRIDISETLTNGQPGRHISVTAGEPSRGQ